MKIAGMYSFNGGSEFINKNFSRELAEVKEILDSVDINHLQRKTSKEKTMPGRILFSPRHINSAISGEFIAREWHKQKVPCEYPTEYYQNGYQPVHATKGAFREMDFIKHKLGVEVQFGKYSFMVYNVCAKMTIFNRMGFIEAGVEIVPIKGLADEMSTGVSYFEQFVWDMEHRGVSNIDIPVLILGVAK